MFSRSEIIRSYTAALLLSLIHIFINNLRLANCDGIDPDHCSNVRISNCHIAVSYTHLDVYKRQRHQTERNGGMHGIAYHLGTFCPIILGNNDRGTAGQSYEKSHQQLRCV